MSIELELKEHKLIAILRGLEPTQAISYAQQLISNGVRYIEVPLTDPNALKCIEVLKEQIEQDIYIGAGTVVNSKQLDDVTALGVDFALAPNMNTQLIERAVKQSLFFIPGIATATEAFDAISAGATWLKLFPCQSYHPSHIKALKAVMSKHIHILAVGGVSQTNAIDWFDAGAEALGVGSDLYRASDTVQQVNDKAKAFAHILAKV